MTAYHGGKQKIGRELAQIIYDTSMDISEEEDFEIKGYCEPFCGMLGVCQHIPELLGNKINYKAGDLNKSVILMWEAVQKGWSPPVTCSESYYNYLRYNGEDSAEKGFLGHQCSFGGIYFGSYALNYGKTSNTIKNSSKKIQKISEIVKKTNFSHGEYTQFSNLKGYIIYCDPPYYNTTQKYKNSFDNENFWRWCKFMAQYNILFISEYKAPKGVKKIWEKYINSGSYNGVKNKKIEKMYVI